MASTSAYDLSNEKLIGLFSGACLKAGASNSRTVLNPSGRYDMAEAAFLQGVVLARLDGKEPPFIEGTSVQVIQVNRRFLFVSARKWDAPLVRNENKYVVRRVLYDERTWYLNLISTDPDHNKDIAEHYYMADEFEEVPCEAIESDIPS